MNLDVAQRELGELTKTVGLDLSNVGALETLRPSPREADTTPVEGSLHGARLPRFDVSRDAGGQKIPSHNPGADLELLGLLGAGGMGEVWLAHQGALDRDVAVKTLPGEVFSADAACALLAEARATGALEHPSIVPVHALGTGPGGAPLLVMKRVEGATVDALISDVEHPAWPALERRHGDRLLAYIEILMQVADALHFAHSRGFVHRDVKPENIMVGPFGETYLLDWGIALRVDEAGSDDDQSRVAILGTPAFMAPELARGAARAIDARTDVYLLGATLHTMLTGQPPHEGDGIFAVLLSAMLSEEKQYRHDVPDELAAIARRCMHADPAERPPSAQALRNALAAYLRHRVSLNLAHEAEERLGELGDRPTAEVLCDHQTTLSLAEARFGFVQALREWPGNTLAEAGLERTIRFLVEAELARGNPDSAEAHIGLLTEPDAGLATRIAMLRAKDEERNSLAAQARQERVETDPTVRGGYRAGLAAVAVIPASGVLLFLLASGEGEPPPVWYSMLIDLFVFAFVGGAALAFRDALLPNRWGRQAVGLLLVASIAAFGTGGVTMIQGHDLHVDVPYRTMVFSALFAGSALYVSPRLWIAAVWGVCAALLSAWWPALSLPAFVSTILLAIFLMVLVSVRRRGLKSDSPRP